MGFIHFRTKKASRPRYLPEQKREIQPEEPISFKLEAHEIDREFYFNQLRRGKDYYQTIEHKKSNGEKRFISVPTQNLLEMQEAILKHYLSEPFLYHSAAYAYIKGKSSNACARVHKNATWLIKIDISNFFHHIDERQVFRELRARGIQEFDAFALARFMTRVIDERVEWLPRKFSLQRRHKLSTKFQVRRKRLGFVPQGSPTSGAISNLACFDLDNDISAITEPHGLSYTRYADDLIISGEKGFDREFVESILKQVLSIVRRNGFKTNTQKTRIIPPGARMRILGVLVGGGSLRLPVETRKRLDNELRSIEKFGFKSHARFTKFKNEAALLNHLYGYFVWALDVNQNWAEPRIERLKELAEAQLGDAL